ncbi:MAG: complex I NDUFA9 subunit family protein [Rhodospirillales bacterium]|nr:complex I NDUFA9 subunit family protein [Rhodospirillales bacterium]
MALEVVTVFGGSGFLGRRIAARMADAGAAVQVAVRRPERFDPGTLAEPGRVSALRADVRDETSVAAALAGADAVVNAVGLYVEGGGETFRAVHVEGAERVARLAARAGARALVQISGIGADPGSRSAYVRARAEGEVRTLAAFPGATILRPSVLFGPDDAFLTLFARMARLLPLLPIFGRGATRLQPAHVDDVAEAVVRALEDPAAKGRVYELGGPRAYSYRELLSLVMAAAGRRRPLLPVPYTVWHLLARLAAVLPRPPLTRDQVILMEQDNVVGPDFPGFAELGIVPRSVEDSLPSCLSPG